MESLHKRYAVIFRFDHNIDILLQEPAEKGEESTIMRWKRHMESIRGMGNVVGDYVGDSQGDSEHATQAIVSADLNSGMLMVELSKTNQMMRRISAIMQNLFCLCTIVRQQDSASMMTTLLI